MALEPILLAVGPKDSDRAEKLADFAVDIAAPADSTVVLAHVFTEEEYTSATEQLGIESPTEVTPDEVARRHSTTRAISKALDDAGVNHEIRGTIGPHGDEIIRLAAEDDSGLVVVGGRKRSPTGKAVFGSTAQEVMLSAPCPVTFVRGE
ncbi:universal stress protein [Halobacterium noricense]|uniref:universal stress protein n=1 Tax=Halobacterium noricense TaxID=223182 RepID=UPI001E4FF230|nr:universal stress protein [Halobacterium noricense]UHH26815.1 universal stress protein [Halobacterium noricense]